MEAAVVDAESSIEFDLLFHMAILEATHNAFMRPFGALIQEALRASFRLTNKDRLAYERSLKRHRDVFDAIKKKDPDAAESTMRLVLNRTSEDIERSLPSIPQKKITKSARKATQHGKSNSKVKAKRNVRKTS